MKLSLTVLALGLLAAACSPQSRSASEPGTLLVAEAASFDLSTDRPERFIVGLFASDRGDVALGTVQLGFDYLGVLDGSSPPEFVDSIEAPAPVSAGFQPIPGTEQVQGDTPTFDPPDGARGVYGTAPISFGEAGVWEVTVTASVDGEPLQASGLFEVFEEPTVPIPGEQAPRSTQPLPGDPTVPPSAIDSMLTFSEELGDPALHTTTVSDALDSGRPLMVVVATPAFCVSRFCGPITDELAKLQVDYGDQVEFAHLEVWQDFEALLPNPAAAEWIAPRGVENAAEPWVFLVDDNGVITNRWDNVATVSQLTEALEAVVAN